MSMVTTLRESLVEKEAELKALCALLASGSGVFAQKQESKGSTAIDTAIDGSSIHSMQGMSCTVSSNDSNRKRN